MVEITSIKKLGALVRKTRKSQGLTQEKLAAVSGVGVRFIRELEKGKESCEIGKVIQVMQMLGIGVFASMRRSTSGRKGDDKTTHVEGNTDEIL